MAHGKAAHNVTVEQTVETLAGWHHSFVAEQSANEVAKAFGIAKPVPCYAGHSDRSGNPKGLSMRPGAEGSRGIAGWRLAEWICDQLGVEYERKTGRGFQTQACVESLSEHFKITKE